MPAFVHHVVTLALVQIPADPNQQKDKGKRARGRGAPERHRGQAGEGHERKPRQQRRPAGAADGVQRRGDQAGRELEADHDHGGHHRGAEAVLLRRDGHHRRAADMDDGRPEHAPGVAAPCEGGGPARLRRQPPGLGRHTPTENCQYSPATARTSLQLEMEF